MLLVALLFLSAENASAQPPPPAASRSATNPSADGPTDRPRADSSADERPARLSFVTPETRLRRLRHRGRLLGIGSLVSLIGGAAAVGVVFFVTAGSSHAVVQRPGLLLAPPLIVAVPLGVAGATLVVRSSRRLRHLTGLAPTASLEIGVGFRVGVNGTF